MQIANLDRLRGLLIAGCFSEAREGYECLLGLGLHKGEASAGLGTIYLQQGDLAGALDYYSLALEEDPDNAEVLCQKGLVLSELSLFQDALDCFTAAQTISPESAEIYNNRAVVLRAMGRLQEALQDYNHAITLQPCYGQAWRNRGIVLRGLKRLDEAIKSYDQAISIYAEDAQAWNYRGHVLREQGLLEQALASYAEAVRSTPEYAEAHYNSSIVLRELSRLDEAIHCCDLAVTYAPDYADAWWNKAEILILKGDFAQGWPMFEWRWKSFRHGKTFRDVGKPLWLGDGEILGKRILLSVDGGLGDTIQFCRYAHLLKKRGANVIIEAADSLLPLLKESFDSIELTAYQNPLPTFDLHCPQMSLPGAFKESADSIYAPLPYLKPPASFKNFWSEKLGEKTRPRIGIVWSGGCMHYKGQEHRSVPLHELHDLLSLDAEFHCLQKVILNSDQDALTQVNVQTWEEHLHDFAETAALTSLMDLVISIDTAVAHLAGALQKDVWVMLPSDADMRWMIARSDSPWYPGVMRLFRQVSCGSWREIIHEVGTELNAWLNQPHSEVSLA